MLATMAFARLRPGQPYGVEVIADANVHFSKESFSHPLRPFWRWWFTRNQRKQCKQAACCLYVTERVLQQRYPPGPPTKSQSSQSPYAVGVSDVEMKDEAFIDLGSQPCGGVLGRLAEVNANRAGRFRVAYVGNLEHYVKGPDILVRSFARAVSSGLDAELVMIGDGRERHQIEALAQSLGLGERIKFLGQLSAGEAVRRQLDASDLFVLPSRSEGMPRAMIEAMARGLPSIGSRVGGIPELLPEAALVPPGDVEALTTRILQFARDPKLRAEMAQQNLASAHRYHESILQPKRIAFYQSLRDATEAWQNSKRGVVGQG
jgi:glycosyltransferase involved in cell wall biosynthesis